MSEKIFISVLFTLTRLEAKIWAHFPKQISVTEKKKKPTSGCRVWELIKRNICIYTCGENM